jgi:hypothetical protein
VRREKATALERLCRSSVRRVPGFLRTFTPNDLFFWSALPWLMIVLRAVDFHRIAGCVDAVVPLSSSNCLRRSD